MTKLERLQKYIIVLILLLSLVIAGGVTLMLRRTAALPQAAESSVPDNELTETAWYYPDSLHLGQLLTESSFTLPDGSSTPLSAHLGENITLAMYWGSWCSYCEKQTELLLSLQNELAKRGVQVLLIDKMDPQKESLEAAQTTIREKSIPFDWVIDQDLRVYNELGLHIIPTTFLLDASGRVLFCHAGTIENKEELTAMLDYAQSTPRAQTEQFVKEHLTTQDGGVQLHVQAQTAASPSGQDVLAESQGMMMEYAALTQNAPLFEHSYGYVQQNLDENGLLRWYGTKSGDTAKVNALLDDLRVLRALHSFGGYEAAISRHAGAISQNMRDESGRFVDFYTFASGEKSHRLTLCYLDWRALDVLLEQQPDCADSVQAAQKILDGGYLGDAFPFYANYYDYETGAYDTGSLNMAEAMLTLLHQAEAGRLPDASLQWLRTQMQKNGIWARYDTSGRVVSGSEYQSAAVYAIVGLIALQCGDETLLTQAVSRMESFRCFDASSPLNGAFAPSMQEASSFDQCLALVLYAQSASIVKK